MSEDRCLMSAVLQNTTLWGPAIGAGLCAGIACLCRSDAPPPPLFHQISEDRDQRSEEIGSVSVLWYHGLQRAFLFSVICSLCSDTGL